VCLAALLLWSPGCLTYEVVYDAHHAEGNVTTNACEMAALLPLTLAFDVATSPFQVWFWPYLLYMEVVHGHRWVKEIM